MLVVLYALTREQRRQISDSTIKLQLDLHFKRKQKLHLKSLHGLNSNCKAGSSEKNLQGSLGIALCNYTHIDWLIKLQHPQISRTRDQSHRAIG